MRNILQDIKPLTGKKVPLVHPNSHHEIDQSDEPIYIDSSLYEPTPRRKVNLFIWLALGGSLIALFFGFSILFTRVTITIIPKNETNLVDITLNAISNTTEKNILAFEIMSIDGEEKTTLTSTTPIDVKQKANGQVIIYNTFSTASQRLVKDTRLSDITGKIFRITEAVVVPGLHIEKGKTIPGSVSVNAVADVAGLEYNIGLTDFTIPGFKGSPKYQKIYARSKTPMSGGTSGKSYVIDKATAKEAVTNLSTSVKNKLWQETKAQVPKGYIAFDTLSVFTTSPAPSSGFQSDTPSVEITEKGTLTVFLLNEQVLNKQIATKAVTGYDGSDVTILNIHDLAFTANISDGIIPKDLKTLNIHITGSPKVSYSVPQSDVIATLTGKSRNEFDSIISGFPSIHSAELSIKPFWIHTIPDDQKKIHFVISDPFLGK